jgi:hypothetical protein
LLDRFPFTNSLKLGDALSPLLFDFALEYAIKRVQVNQGGLNFSDMYELLAYGDDVNILRGSVHTVTGNPEALVVTTKALLL